LGDFGDLGKFKSLPSFMETARNSFGLEVLRVMTMKSTALWVVMPCRSENARSFRGTYHLHYQGRGKIKVRTSNKQEASRASCWFTV
jgi:hypothetical protein